MREQGWTYGSDEVNCPMAELERRCMGTDRYLDDWFIEDEVMDVLSEAEYEIYMMECGEEYELG